MQPLLWKYSRISRWKSETGLRKKEFTRFWIRWYFCIFVVRRVERDVVASENICFLKFNRTVTQISPKCKSTVTNIHFCHVTCKWVNVTPFWRRYLIYNEVQMFQKLFTMNECTERQSTQNKFIKVLIKGIIFRSPFWMWFLWCLNDIIRLDLVGQGEVFY